MNLKKEKSIETPELKVKGNIMSWDGMMIQLSNVSSVSTAPLDQLAFPMLSVLLIFVGIVGLKQELFFGVLLLVLGGAWIYGWYYINNTTLQLL